MTPENLQALSDEDLHKIRDTVTRILSERSGPLTEYPFSFDEKYRPGVHERPYVARISADGPNIRRTFIALRNPGKGKLIVTQVANYTAKENEIIEEFDSRLSTHSFAVVRDGFRHDFAACAPADLTGVERLVVELLHGNPAPIFIKQLESHEAFMLQGQYGEVGEVTSLQRLIAEWKGRLEVVSAEGGNV